MDRQTGGSISYIPAACNHDGAQLSKHPQNPDHVLDLCSLCEEIRAYSINTKRRFVVYKDSNMIRMFDGPAGSLLVLDSYIRLYKLNLDEYPSRAVFLRELPSKMLNKRFLRFCYVDYFNILLYTVEREQHYEIMAIKVEGGNILWRLFGPVAGCVIQPKFITCDPDGNAYVSDRRNNRILKINSLTGDVLSILLVDEEQQEIESICWSNTEPNLTTRGRNKISSYFVPE